VSTIDYIVFIL